MQNEIPCKGYSNVETLNRGRARNRDVAKWILENKRSQISGTVERVLEGMVAERPVIEVDCGDESLIIAQNRNFSTALGVLHEFEAAVPH